MFKPLTMTDVTQIVQKLIDGLANRVAEQEIGLQITAAAAQWLARRGYLPAFGARPLQRTVVNEVETPLAKLIIGGRATAHSTVNIDINETQDGLTFDVVS